MVYFSPVTRDQAKQLIVKAVLDLGGCKAIELAAREDLVPAFLEYHLPELIQELVSEEELIELEYSLPNRPYRAKSFLLPKGTSYAID